MHKTRSTFAQFLLRDALQCKAWSCDCMSSICDVGGLLWSHRFLWAVIRAGVSICDEDWGGANSLPLL